MQPRGISSSDLPPSCRCSSQPHPRAPLQQRPYHMQRTSVHTLQEEASPAAAELSSSVPAQRQVGVKDSIASCWQRAGAVLAGADGSASCSKRVGEREGGLVASPAGLAGQGASALVVEAAEGAGEAPDAFLRQDRDFEEAAGRVQRAVSLTSVPCPSLASFTSSRCRLGHAERGCRRLTQ